MNRIFLIGFLLAAVSCAGRCACTRDQTEPSRTEPSSPRLGTLRWAITAKAHEPLELVGEPGRLSVSEGSGTAAWVADGARGAWLHHLVLRLQVNRLVPGPSGVSLATSRCRFRYLQDARETEADYSVSKASVRGLSFDGVRWTAEVDVVCEKLVPERADGAPYAAALPDRVRVRGTAWAR